MNIILFDNESHYHLLPLTHSRPVAEIRCGILTIKEKWENIISHQIYYHTLPYLQNKFPIQVNDDNLFINAALMPDEEIIEKILSLENGKSIFYQKKLIAIRLNKEKAQHFIYTEIKENEQSIKYEKKLQLISSLSDIFTLNDWAIREDFKNITKNKTSNQLSNTNNIIGDNIFIEEGVTCSHALIDTTSGPVYIGKNAELMMGAMIKGPVAIGQNSTLKMGAKIYGATTIGPGCKVGGEVNNSVFFANSNKAHDGFIGNAVIGEWCNIGADTNNSNLKNNYENVKLWSEYKNTFLDTGLQFCGLIMADHSKCGINTMFNTGTVIGHSCNIYGEGFPRNFIPSFSWGGYSGFTEYKLNKAIETATKVFERRNIAFNEIEKKLFENIFNNTVNQRNYSK